MVDSVGGSGGSPAAVPVTTLEGDPGAWAWVLSRGTVAVQRIQLVDFVYQGCSGAGAMRGACTVAFVFAVLRSRGPALNAKFCVNLKTETPVLSSGVPLAVFFSQKYVQICCV